MLWFFFLPVPFNLRHVYSLLHHFLGKSWARIKWVVLLFSLLVLCFTFCSFSVKYICSQKNIQNRGQWKEVELCCARGWELAWICISFRHLVSRWSVMLSWRLCIQVYFKICYDQAATVSYSPWKVCLWWFQTTDSPSFPVPVTPWHRKSICWADNTWHRQVYTIIYKIVALQHSSDEWVLNLM